jgi:microcystin-dependent protein
MKFNNVGYMFRPSEAQWNSMIATLPRQNLEELLYDLSFSSGVLSGLELTQAVAPNLTIKVGKGRAVYLDTATRRGKVAEFTTDQTLDLASFLPVGSPSTVLIVITPQVVTSTSITPANAAPTEEDYDAAYTPTPFDFLEADSATLSVVGVATGNQIVLGSVTLSAGQTQILNTHIRAQNVTDSPRQIASPNPKVLELEQKLAELEPQVTPIGSIITWGGPVATVPTGYLACDGSLVSRVQYPKLYQAIGQIHGSNDGATNFRVPNMIDRFIVGAGNLYAPANTGGANTVTLSEGQLPEHDHPITINAVGDHDHAITVANSGEHRHPFRASNATSGGGAGDNVQYGSVTGGFADVTNPQFGVLEDGEHTHTADAQPDGGHSHTADVGNAGNSQAHENRPLYYAVIYAIRAL